MSDDKKAITDLAMVNVTLIARLQRSERVVAAARAFVNDPGHLSTMFALDEAVDEYDAGGPC